jgi:DNA-binding MarR family transcriptional regulator
MVFKQINNEKKILYILLIIFIITELTDDLLDYILGSSIVHSILQLSLFIILFFIVARIYLGYYRKRIKNLIPEELRKILEIVKESEIKGVIINLRSIRKIIKITKPTLKKRIDQLVYLNYISFEKQGNNKYIKITTLGDSLLR